MAHYVRALAVSGDGKRALVFASEYAWLINTETMVASAPIALPGDVESAVLNGDGRVALFIADETLYRWAVDADTPDFQVVWKSAALSDVQSLRMTPDARVAIASGHNSKTLVRVFDLDALTMTYSFEADTDEGLLLHPGGRHIICFGHDYVARFYGEDGPFFQTGGCGGGAISPDGRRLIVSNRESPNSLRAYTLPVEGNTMGVSRPQEFHVSQQLSRYSWRASFSPSGRYALLQGDNEHGAMLDFSDGSTTYVEAKIEWTTALLADETSILTPNVYATRLGVHSSGVALWDSGSNRVAAILCPTLSDPPVLAAITPMGLYGSIEAEPRPTREELVMPYERPELMSQLLSRSGNDMGKGDRLRLEEAGQRHAVWEPFYSYLTTDINIRQLMDINRGLIELTIEIVYRAFRASAGLPHFGAQQLSLRALHDAGDELRALPRPARERVFEAMVRRMRSK